MDSLSKVMNWLRMEGHIYGRMELTAPFGLRFPYQYGICLIVTRGTCYLNTDKSPLLVLSAGDFAFIPNSEVFFLRSHPNVKADKVISAEQASDYISNKSLIHSGTSGLTTSLISGCFEFTLAESKVLLKRFPKILHLKADEVSAWVQPLMQLIQTEIVNQTPGSATVIDRAAEILLMQAIRKQLTLSSQLATPSWLRGIGDEKIGRALEIIQNNFNLNLTVQKLAHDIGMSRSNFADRFKKVVGQTPLEYLTEWRMVQAAHLMQESKEAKLSSIAEAVGYESDAAFRKAFARVIGKSPRDYRKLNQ